MPFSKARIKFFKNFNWILFIVTVLLFTIGVLVIYSATFEIAGTESKNILSQLIFGGVGLALLISFSFFDYRTLKNFAGILYLLMLGLLLFVTFFGKTALGATRWIDFGFFQLQPSEIAKIIMIICLAKYFSEHAEEINRLKCILISFIYVIIPVVLVALQPDLGTALVFLIIWISMLLVSNIKRIYFLYLGGAGILSLPLLWSFLKDYQKQRIMTFLNPSLDPLGSGWNVKQAMIAIGSGKFFGRGLGHGPQSKLKFLPLQHTDFIFAVLAEEMGFLGALVVIGLFFVLLYSGLRTAKISRDNFGMFLATGICAMIFFHIFINIGMNIGIMPVTGIPLPLLSYGGTSLIVTLVSIGILESIYMRHKKIEF